MAYFPLTETTLTETAPLCLNMSLFYSFYGIFPNLRVFMTFLAQLLLKKKKKIFVKFTLEAGGTWSYVWT